MLSLPSFSFFHNCPLEKRHLQHRKDTPVLGKILLSLGACIEETGGRKPAAVTPSVLRGHGCLDAAQRSCRELPTGVVVRPRHLGDLYMMGLGALSIPVAFAWLCLFTVLGGKSLAGPEVSDLDAKCRRRPCSVCNRAAEAVHGLGMKPRRVALHVHHEPGIAIAGRWIPREPDFGGPVLLSTRHFLRSLLSSDDCPCCRQDHDAFNGSEGRVLHALRKAQSNSPDTAPPHAEGHA